ncbi:MAG: hypothetical protein Kow00127_15390 [Bacteroidales bacterium]
MSLLITGGVYAQQRAVLPESLRNKAVKYDKQLIKDTGAPFSSYVPGAQPESIMSEDQVGGTMYDLQTNSSTQNRIYLFDDGTIGTVWNMGFDPSGFAQRGTGYNYYDGSAWGPEPTVRLEDTKTGWPSYFPYGENGEMFVSHHMTAGLYYGYRTEKGTGDWTFEIQAGPPSAVDISWPRGITTGADHSVIHFISVTYAPYNGQDNALLYSRSTDGGVSWDPENHFFDELGPSNYYNIGGDVYEWAEPKNGILAFLVGDPWVGLVLMKSLDDGDSWEKTTIWECPFPLNNGTQLTDTFYCADGSHHLAIDNSGKIHVVFGINRAYGDEGGQYWFPGVDGVGYWNEDMPTFSSDINALNPYGHPDSELIEDVNLIGWSQDVNGNGELDLLDDWGTYYLGLSSMVQIAIDDMNEVFVLFSSVTEGFDNTVQNYRHVWARSSVDGGVTWGPFYDLNGDFIYQYDECVYPSLAANTDDNLYYIYQADSEPGIAVQGDQDPYGDNYMRVRMLDKQEIISGVSEHMSSYLESNVSQNAPNPASEYTHVLVRLDQPSALRLEVADVTGKVVYRIAEKDYPAGLQTFTLDVSNLDSGVYFYTVYSGKASATRKMIVE